MTETVTTWESRVVERVQSLLDWSLQTAGSVQRSFFGKPERRLDALTFLVTWNRIYMCAAATSGSGRWPHLAGVRLEFNAEAELHMLLYQGGPRERDLRDNPRVALQKQDDDGTVLTVYASAKFDDEEAAIDRRGRSHVQVRLMPLRLYGMGPYVSGPFSNTGKT